MTGSQTLADLVGRPLPTQTLTWTSRDTQLYALGVGAGIDPLDELELTTDNSHGIDQVVLPTFGFVLAQQAGVSQHLGPLKPPTVLHAAQELQTFRALPPAGECIAKPVVESVQDKGRAAIATIATTISSPDGDPYLLSKASLYLPGMGGWGGPRGDTATRWTASGQPDHTWTFTVPPSLALLYRQSGDLNPLHSDPVFAQKAGFDRPILHGLCTIGICARLAWNGLRHSSGVETPLLASLRARLSTPVIPGQTLIVSAWNDPTDGGVRFEASAGDAVVLEGGYLKFGGRND